MSGSIFGSLDFLPQNINPLLRTFIYVMLLAHLLVLILWMVYTCPTMFKQNPNNIRNRVEKAMKEK